MEPQNSWVLDLWFPKSCGSYTMLHLMLLNYLVHPYLSEYQSIASVGASAADHNHGVIFRCREGSHMEPSLLFNSSCALAHSFLPVCKNLHFFCCSLLSGSLLTITSSHDVHRRGHSPVCAFCPCGASSSVLGWGPWDKNLDKNSQHWLFCVSLFLLRIGKMFPSMVRWQGPSVITPQQPLNLFQPYNLCHFCFNSGSHHRSSHLGSELAASSPSLSLVFSLSLCLSNEVFKKIKIPLKNELLNLSPGCVLL